MIGAPEVIARGADKEDLRERARDLASSGARLLLLARGDDTMSAEHPGPLVPVAFVHLREELRADAAETIAYFFPPQWQVFTPPLIGCHADVTQHIQVNSNWVCAG